MEATTDFEEARFEGVVCRFEWSQEDGVRVARISGDVDMSNADHLMEALLQLGNRSLIVDLVEVSFMDSTGLRALLDLEQRLAPRSLSLRIRSGGRVERLLEVTGMREHFSITACH